MILAFTNTFLPAALARIRLDNLPVVATLLS